MSDTTPIGEKLDVLEKSVDTRFDSVGGRFDAVDARFAALEAKVDSTAQDLRRHFDVVAEGLRAGIRLFFESLDAHGSALDDHEKRIKRLESR